MCSTFILRNYFNIEDECSFSLSLIQVGSFAGEVKRFGIKGFLLYVRARFILRMVREAGE
jgi:hypothetical protein